jgi:hypothetical protein
MSHPHHLTTLKKSFTRDRYHSQGENHKSSKFGPSFTHCPSFSSALSTPPVSFSASGRFGCEKVLSTDYIRVLVPLECCLNIKVISPLC